MLAIAVLYSPALLVYIAGVSTIAVAGLPINDDSDPEEVEARRTQVLSLSGSGIKHVSSGSSSGTVEVEQGSLSATTERPSWRHRNPHARKSIASSGSSATTTLLRQAPSATGARKEDSGIKGGKDKNEDDEEEEEVERNIRRQENSEDNNSDKETITKSSAGRSVINFDRYKSVDRRSRSKISTTTTTENTKSIDEDKGDNKNEDGDDLNSENNKRKSAPSSPSSTSSSSTGKVSENEEMVAKTEANICNGSNKNEENINNNCTKSINQTSVPPSRSRSRTGNPSSSSSIQPQINNAPRRQRISDSSTSTTTTLEPEIIDLGNNHNNVYKKRRRPVTAHASVLTTPTPQTMSYSLYDHFRPLDQEVPQDHLLPFLDFGKKLSPGIVPPPTPSGIVNSIENNKSSRSRTRDHHHYISTYDKASFSTPDEDVVHENMDVTVMKKAIERNTAPRGRIQLREPVISSSYYRRRPSTTTTATTDNLVLSTTECVRTTESSNSEKTTRRRFATVPSHDNKCETDNGNAQTTSKSENEEEKNKLKLEQEENRQNNNNKNEDLRDQDEEESRKIKSDTTTLAPKLNNNNYEDDGDGRKPPKNVQKIIDVDIINHRGGLTRNSQQSSLISSSSPSSLFRNKFERMQSLRVHHHIPTTTNNPVSSLTSGSTVNLNGEKRYTLSPQVATVRTTERTYSPQVTNTVRIHQTPAGTTKTTSTTSSPLNAKIKDASHHPVTTDPLQQEESNPYPKNAQPSVSPTPSLNEKTTTEMTVQPSNPQLTTRILSTAVVTSVSVKESAKNSNITTSKAINETQEALEDGDLKEQRKPDYGEPSLKDIKTGLNAQDEREKLISVSTVIPDTPVTPIKTLDYITSNPKSPSEIIQNNVKASSSSSSSSLYITKGEELTKMNVSKNQYKNNDSMPTTAPKNNNNMEIRGSDIIDLPALEKEIVEIDAESSTIKGTQISTLDESIDFNSNSSLGSNINNSEDNNRENSMTVLQNAKDPSSPNPSRVPVKEVWIKPTRVTQTQSEIETEVGKTGRNNDTQRETDEKDGNKEIKEIPTPGSSTTATSPPPSKIHNEDTNKEEGTHQSANEEDEGRNPNLNKTKIISSSNNDDNDKRNEYEYTKEISDINVPVSNPSEVPHPTEEEETPAIVPETNEDVNNNDEDYITYNSNSNFNDKHNEYNDNKTVVHLNNNANDKWANAPSISVVPKHNKTLNGLHHQHNLYHHHHESGSDVGVAYPEGISLSTYVLSGLGVIPVLLLAAMAARLIVMRNRKKKVLDESEYSSEYNRSPLSTTGPSLRTKLPRLTTHLGWEVEKNKLPPIPVTSPRWEFPRDKLRLQTVLGQGNFGQVWKAEADDISGHEGLTRLVAVKTVKEGATGREREDLLRELGIMQELGAHPNVVTLLGCCTEKEPYLLIMEYVMYGKLLAFLRDHRTRAHYYNFSDATDALTSRDLTVFAYCVARGMDYLTSKSIIHRDLAARNVLVDHNKLCKIADFGMSRNVRDTGQIYEQRQCKGALPIRWMAPESLHFSLFTHKTDVWSFGILMWEIVTLGSTPYATMGAREVMRRVREGYRLDRPSHCHQEIFRVIARCWHSEPAKRPTFAELKQELGQLLGDSEHGGGYVDLDGLADEMRHQQSQSSGTSGSTLQRHPTQQH